MDINSAKQGEKMQLINQLNEIIDEKHLLKHEFYQAWSRGKLSRQTLQHYAAQYYKQVESFPCFISRVHTHCPAIAARKVLLENLVDEEIHGTDHPALWMQFAEGLGLTREQVMQEPSIAETKEMVDKYYALADRHWGDGLCALFAYESQVPVVAESKVTGLKQFYGVHDDKALEFFIAHQVYDVGHAKKVAELIEYYVEPERAIVATHEATHVLWGFLDGMCRVHSLAC
jgi:pyrroloquinoline-quinone synthase